MVIINEKFEEIVQRTEESYSKRETERKSRLEKKKQNQDFSSFEEEKRLDCRKKLLNDLDGLAWERIIGQNDLLGINYLELGLRASRTVCRLEIRNIRGQILGYGTGFLVSPNLLMTNNHVLETEEISKRSLAEFNFEDDADFYPKKMDMFTLQPEKFFYTNKDLDCTIVAVNPISRDGKSLSDFGFLKLIGDSGKAIVGEHVTIVQHPGGSTKSITLRDNEIVDFFDNKIHYESDTQPGSSGSPVFNDQWEVVCLHHSGVRKKDDQGRPLSLDGHVWEPSMGVEKIAWIANEGIRISSIMSDLKLVKNTLFGEQLDLLEEIETGQILSSTVARVSETEIEQEKLEYSYYDNKKGFDEDFIGSKVSLPKLSQKQLEDCAKILDKDGYETDENELKYDHFSVIMNKIRKLAYFTAVNIDGKLYAPIRRGHDKWIIDSRINDEYQSDNKLYQKNDLDRGHLVRRLDPVWGNLAESAEKDTFHYTNAAPQHKDLNRKTWLELESYILNRADEDDLKINVFTGPIFRADDMLYRNVYKIPAEFWKIVVLKKNGKLISVGFCQTQKDLIGNMESAFIEYDTYQVPITNIEELTGLNFGELRNYDPQAEVEGTTARRIYSSQDIRL